MADGARVTQDQLPRNVPDTYNGAVEGGEDGIATSAMIRTDNVAYEQDKIS